MHCLLEGTARTYHYMSETVVLFCHLPDWMSFLGSVFAGTTFRGGINIAIKCRIEFAWSTLTSDGQTTSLVIAYATMDFDANTVDPNREKVITIDNDYRPYIY